MATENLRRRIRDVGPDVDDYVEDDKEDTSNEDYDDDNDKPKETKITKWWRAAIARRGLPSLLSFLFFGVAAPASLHVMILYFRFIEGVPAKPTLIVVACATNLHLLFSSLIVGLCSWFAWAGAQNGFRRKPATMVVLFLVYFSLGVAWDKVTIGLGELKVGILITVVRLPFAIVIGRNLHGLNCKAANVVTHAGGLVSFYIFRNTLDIAQRWGGLFN